MVKTLDLYFDRPVSRFSPMDYLKPSELTGFKAKDRHGGFSDCVNLVSLTQVGAIIFHKCIKTPQVNKLGKWEKMYEKPHSLYLLT